MPSIPFYHSTDWDGMKQIISDDLIKPQISNISSGAPQQFDFLIEKKIPIAWFSSQRWSLSKFGSYTFGLDETDLITPEMVEFGKYNGARCYLAAPEPLVRAIANACQISVITTKNNNIWHPEHDSDRVDIITPWPVPIGNKISFNLSNKSKLLYCESLVQYAKSCFIAHILKTNNKKFDSSLEFPIELGSDMLYTILGFGNIFKNNNTPSTQQQTTCTSNPDFWDVINSLADGNITNARTQAAIFVKKFEEIEEKEKAIADQIARLISNRFSVDVTGQTLLDRL